MINIPSSALHVHPDIQTTLRAGKPVLALESTILAHGMPYPENMTFALRAEAVVRAAGVEPATIGIIDGKITIGLQREALLRLCQNEDVQKVALRDLSYVLYRKATGATTVSATMAIAAAAGVHVFSTGGIGGVHRNLSRHFDISQDIQALGQFPLVVVSAGAKAILDLPNTLEALETAGVPVIGYQTDVFPSFYSRSSSLPTPFSVTSVTEIAAWYAKHLALGNTTALLIANPVPAAEEIREETMRPIIAEALRAADKNGVSGKALTPYLLQTIVEKTKGRALRTNVALALNNFRLGCQIAKEISLRLA